MALRPVRKQRGNARTQNAAITAAAEQLSERIALNNGQGVTIGEPWQREALDLYDQVPELRTAATVTGQAMSQCRLVIARVQTNGEPAPLDLSLDAEGNPNTPDDFNHPAVALLAQFAGGAGGQTELLDMIGNQLTVTGEVICVGTADPALQRTDDFYRMQAYSIEQVQQRSNGRTVIKQDTSMAGDRIVEESDPDDDMVNPDNVLAFRVWRPHPKFNWKADSAAKAAMGVLREIAMYDMHIEASGISRLISAGIMKVPEGLTLPGVAEEDLDPDGNDDPFLQLLMQVASIAIKNRQSAAARIPIMVRGEAEDLAAMDMLYLSTPFDDKVADLRDRAIKRLAVAVDMPPDILLGLGDTQHWVGAQITEDWKKSYLQWLMSFTCSAITTGWLYPALLVTVGENAKADVIVWFDDSSVRTRENTGPEAQAAYDRGEISGEAYRRALGYDDSDVAEGQALMDQMLKILLLKAPALAPVLLPILVPGLPPTVVADLQKSLAAGTVPGGSNPGALPESPGGQEPAATTQPGEAAAALRQMVYGGNGHRNR